MVNKNDCAIKYEGGSHFDNGRDFDGWFCVHIYKKGRYLWKGGKFKKQ